MSCPSFRAQVLLEPQDFDRLKALARKQGVAISQILRRAIRRYLDMEEEQEQQELLQVLGELRQIRETNAAQYGGYAGDPLDEARQERIRQMENP